MENERTDTQNQDAAEANQSRQEETPGHDASKRQGETFPRSTGEVHVGDPPPETNFGEGGVGAKGGFVGTDRGVEDRQSAGSVGERGPNTDATGGLAGGADTMDDGPQGTTGVDPYTVTDRTGTGLYNDRDDSTHDGLGGVSGTLGNRSDMSAQREDWDNGGLGTNASGEGPRGIDGAEPEGAQTDEERLRSQGAQSSYQSSGSSAHGGIDGVGAATSDEDRGRSAEILGAGPQGRVQVTGATDTSTMPGQPDLSGPDQGDVGDVRRDDSSGLRAQDHGQTERVLGGDDETG